MSIKQKNTDLIFRSPILWKWPLPPPKIPKTPIYLLRWPCLKLTLFNIPFHTSMDRRHVKTPCWEVHAFSFTVKTQDVYRIIHLCHDMLALFTHEYMDTWNSINRNVIIGSIWVFRPLQTRNCDNRRIVRMFLITPFADCNRCFYFLSYAGLLPLLYALQKLAFSSMTACPSTLQLLVWRMLDLWQKKCLPQAFAFLIENRTWCCLLHPYRSLRREKNALLPIRFWYPWKFRGSLVFLIFQQLCGFRRFIMLEFEWKPWLRYGFLLTCWELSRAMFCPAWASSSS